MHSESRRKSAQFLTVLAVAGFATLATLAATCSSRDSYVVLTLRVAQMTPTLMNLTQVRVTVNSGDDVSTLVYPGKSETIDALVGKTLSVSFSDDQTGDVRFAVEVITPTACAKGDGSTIIRKRAVTTLAVTLAPSSCAISTDGSVTDGDSDAVVFPGCDPAALTCGDNMTCHVNCMVSQGMCTPAGSGGHGAACQNDNKKCMPGTQCFDYSVAGCPVTACLKFCKSNNDCSNVTDGGAGNGAACLGDVRCNGRSSGHKTCTFDCDPRGDATIGCPTGLKCFRVQGDDQVDCLCPGPDRIRPEGADCPVAGECAPGLICNEMGAGPTGPIRKCRRICKRSENNADCPVGQTCTMQAANNIYGVCL